MTTSSDTSSSAVVEEIAWKGDPHDPHDVRLLAALFDAHRRVSALTPKMELHIAAACRKLLGRAEDEAARGARYVAWDCLHQLDEEMLSLLSDEERVARWCSVRAEAKEKLKGSWRGEAAECLAKLAPEDKDKPVPLNIVREVQAHLAVAAQNKQHKLELFEKRSLPWVMAWLLLAVAAALAFSYVALVADEGNFASLVPWAKALVLGVPTGALGGVLSMAFSLGQADLKAKTPDMRLSRGVTLIRPLIGATVAIPIVVLVEAGNVKAAGFEGSLAIFAFCFIGGFSERWFLGVMERFEAGKK